MLSETVREGVWRRGCVKIFFHLLIYAAYIPKYENVGMLWRLVEIISLYFKANSMDLHKFSLLADQNDVIAVADDMDENKDAPEKVTA